jgi:CelD/BcsL family acetyltransferase involved in cellulose biosynthesis
MQSLQVVTNLPEFRALKSSWNDLAIKFRNPLYLHEWFDDYLSAYGDESDLKVFVARDDGVVRAIAPLILDRSEGVAQLRILAHRVGETDNSFLYADDASLTTVCAGILHSGFPISLPGLGADANDLHALCQSSRTKGMLVVRPSAVAVASVRLDADWNAIKAKMTNKNRKFIRWAWRAAEREGPVKFEVVTPTEEDLDDHLRDVFRVEAAGWKGQGGSAILSDPKRKHFWQTFSQTAARLGLLRFFFLRIGNATAAVRMAAQYAGRLWDYKIGYDERWARYSPGILLTQETLRYAIEQRLEAFEFLGQAERWQHRWPIDLRYRSTVRFYPLSVGGSLALGQDTWNFWVNRVNRTFSRGKRLRWSSSDKETKWK